MGYTMSKQSEEEEEEEEEVEEGKASSSSCGRLSVALTPALAGRFSAERETRRSRRRMR